jgi:hypothetical protein
MPTVTKAQVDALLTGGLDQYCLDNHPSSVCVHCGTCRSCHSGCQCHDPGGSEPCDCGGCDEATNSDGVLF